MKSITENIKAILSLIIIVFSLIYFFMVTFFNVKVDNQIIIAIVGFSSAVIGYHFGSSSGSSSKDEVINNLTNKE